MAHQEPEGEVSCPVCLQIHNKKFLKCMINNKYKRKEKKYPHQTDFLGVKSLVFLHKCICFGHAGMSTITELNSL